MDADEVMGENIEKAFTYLHTKHYRSFLFPRYNLVDLDPETIIISPHHYSEWQVRMFKNDGKCYYENCQKSIYFTYIFCCMIMMHAKRE